MGSGDRNEDLKEDVATERLPQYTYHVLYRGLDCSLLFCPGIAATNVLGIGW